MSKTYCLECQKAVEILKSEPLGSSVYNHLSCGHKQTAWGNQDLLKLFTPKLKEGRVEIKPTTVDGEPANVMTSGEVSISGKAISIGTKIEDGKIVLKDVNFYGDHNIVQLGVESSQLIYNIQSIDNIIASLNNLGLDSTTRGNIEKNLIEFKKETEKQNPDKHRLVQQIKEVWGMKKEVGLMLLGFALDKGFIALQSLVGG